MLVEEGVQVLLSLLARGLDENPYAEFEFEPDHFDAREIHLLSFKQAWQSTWADMTVEQWVRWLSVHWGIQRHLERGPAQAARGASRHVQDPPTGARTSRYRSAAPRGDGTSTWQSLSDPSGSRSDRPRRLMHGRF